MSWKALDWATDIRVGSPTMRLILILLANKADEKFSCYPSVGTLVTESCAARSTVLETLKRLEVEGFITRVAQYHESGAQRSSRYLLNHPDAPHLKPGPDSGPPGPQVGRGGSDPWTGGVQDLDPPRVQNPDPLNPPEEPPSEPSLTILLQSMPEPWRLSGEEAMELSPAVEYALASGWTSQTLKAHLSRRPDGVRYPAAVLARRLAVLPTPPSPSLRRKTPWCGECEDEQSRTITVTLPDGTEAAAFCPRLQSTEAATAGRPEDSEYRRKVNQLQTNVFDQLPLLLAVPRAAAILGISRAAAYRLAASGELPVRRLGGRVYVVTAELRELVAS